MVESGINKRWNWEIPGWDIKLMHNHQLASLPRPSQIFRFLRKHARNPLCREYPPAGSEWKVPETGHGGSLLHDVHVRPRKRIVNDRYGAI